MLHHHDWQKRILYIYQQIAEELRTTQDTMVFYYTNTNREIKHLISRNHMCPNINRMILRDL